MRFPMRKRLITALALLLAVLAACAAAHAAEASLTVDGKTFTCDGSATEIDLGDVALPNTGEAYSALAAFLRSMPALAKVDMFATEIPQARVEALAAEFPQIRFGWTIVIPCKNKNNPARNKHLLRTDATAFSTCHNITATSHDEHVWEMLKYCPDLMALDLGHNNTIRDISFLNYVPKLRVLIFSFNRKSRGDEGPPLDTTPLGTLKDLEYLEICKSNIADISPLANCTKLVDLNIGTNHISDITPLYGLKSLRRVFLCGCNSYGGRPFPEEEVAKLREQIPDCDVNNETVNLGGTWRQTSHYTTLATMFSYQSKEPQAYIPFDDVPHDGD